MNDADKARCQKAFEKCLGRVAANLIAEKENPYCVPGHEIEGNGTSRKKTLRLLQEAGHIGFYSSNSYRSLKQEFHFKTQFEQQAEALAEEPAFNAVPQEITNAMNTTARYEIISSNIEELSSLGFADIYHLSPRKQIYVWFNREKYLIQKKERTSIYSNSSKFYWVVYPQAMLDQRKLHATRGLFKKYAEPMLMPWLTEKFGLQLLGFDTHTTHEDPFVENPFADYKPKIKLRSTTRFPALFHDKYFDAPKGYKVEYAQRLEWLKNKTEVMKALAVKTAEYGYQRLMTEFVEHAKQELLAEAPILLAEDKESGAGMMLMDNIHLITFDNIFGRNSE